MKCLIWRKIKTAIREDLFEIMLEVKRSEVYRPVMIPQIKVNRIRIIYRMRTAMMTQNLVTEERQEVDHQRKKLSKINLQIEGA